MLTKKVETALNKQIANEAYASSSYLAMASWSESQGLRGCAKFFFDQSDEERVHMLKLVKFVNDAGGRAVVSAIEEPTANYKSVHAVFEAALKQEEGVTKQINKIVELSFNAKDYAAFNFLQWYVEEQVEEENLFRTILDVINLAGREGRALLLLDNEIAKIRAEEAKA